MPVLETGKPLSDLGQSILSANAYLGGRRHRRGAQARCGYRHHRARGGPGPGCWAAALSLWLGSGGVSPRWPWGAGRAPAGMRRAGHGRLLRRPGSQGCAGALESGFPIAEVGEDGSVVITKLPGTGGMSRRRLCKSRSCTRFRTRPVTSLRLHRRFLRRAHRAAGPDRVAVHGATGRCHNGQFKVSVGYQDCWIGEGQISYYGSTARARAELAGEIIRKRLKVRNCAYTELRVI